MMTTGLSLARCVPLPGGTFFAPSMCRRAGGVSGASVLDALRSEGVRGGKAAHVDSYDMLNSMFRFVITCLESDWLMFAR